MGSDFFIEWFADWEGKHEQFYAYADMYKAAVLTIVNAMKPPFDLSSIDSPDQHAASLTYHDYGIIPAMFLFRHYIELQLKGLILHRGGTLKEIDQTHGIDKLLNLFTEKVTVSRISERSKKIILELHQLDSTSQGFRYPYQKDGNRFFKETKKEELEQANMMSEFMNRTNIVFRDLENQEGEFIAIDEEKENAYDQYM